jgi:hypothetical protein
MATAGYAAGREGCRVTTPSLAVVQDFWAGLPDRCWLGLKLAGCPCPGAFDLLPGLALTAAQAVGIWHASISFSSVPRSSFSARASWPAT